MHRGNFALNTPHFRTELSSSRKMKSNANEENCYEDLRKIESLYLRTGKKRNRYRDLTEERGKVMQDKKKYCPVRGKK